MTATPQHCRSTPTTFLPEGAMLDLQLSKLKNGRKDFLDSKGRLFAGRRKKILDFSESLV